MSSVSSTNIAPQSHRDRILNSATPPPHSINPEGIAEALIRTDRWLCWDYKWNGKRQSKVPIHHITGHQIDVNAPANWLTFDAAYRCATANGWGIGLAFNGDFWGLDLDGCRDPQTGELTSWAAEIVRALDTYAEISPTGTGIKIWVSGELPARFGKKHKRPDGRGEVEIFHQVKYFTVTGNRAPGTPDDVHHRPEQLLATYELLCIWNQKSPDAPSSNGTLRPATSDDRSTALAALAVLSNSPGLDYDDWLNVGMALHAVDPSESMCEEWARWSQQSAKHVDGECQRKWRSFGGDGIGIGTLCMLADNAFGKGWRPPKRSTRAFNEQLTGKLNPLSELSSVGVNGSVHDEWTSLRHDQGRTDRANARRFLRTHGQFVRFCFPWDKWLVWDGTHWSIDNAGATMRMAMAVADAVWMEAKTCLNREVADFAVSTSGHSRLVSMLKLAAPDLAIAPDQLDSHPHLLNCLNGTINLKSGELEPHRRENFITKLCPTNFLPGAKAPYWDRFLTSVFRGNELTAPFLQRLMGYCLTGDVSEQILAVFYGGGSNGKSTLLTAIQATLGSDYASPAPPDLLMERKVEVHPTGLAELFGQRLVVAQETNAGAKLAESLVKQLTGGDPISCRRMREDFWTFSPTHKLVICSNYKPRVRGTDHAIWRRLVLVPFEQKFWNPDKGECGDPELKQDKGLSAKLVDEREGILAWMVRGCLAWQQDGLQIPESVRAATEVYRCEQDVVGRFVTECCLTGQSYKVRFTDFFNSFETWCQEVGDNVPSRKVVGKWLQDNGYPDKHSGGRWYLNIGLRATEA